MAQLIKLKRTAVEGKVPTISNVALGELAINTYDGRIFFEKSSSVESIQEILATNTGRAITGSVNLNGSITSSGVLVSANIMPNADNTLSLGSSTQRFQLNGGTPVTVDGSGTANTLTRFQSATTVEDSNIVSSDTATTLTHSNNGNIIFTVSGSNGELLTVTDSNSGNLLEVNDTSGIDVFTVSAIGDVSASGAITASGIMIIDNVSVTGNISGSSFNGTGLLSGSITNQLPSGVVSSSVFSSPSQGTVRATINGTQTNVDTGLQTGDSPQFTNLTLTGNLTVQGTTITENSQEVNIGDNILNLNYGGSSTTGGIYVKDGTGASTTSGSLLWDATNDYWKAGKLGSEEEILLRNTHGVISGSSQVFSDISGDITIASNGTAAIGNGVIVNADINSSAAIASSKINYDGTGIVSGSQQIKDLDFVDLSSTQTITGAKTFNASGNSIIVGDTLRIAEDGSGMRMTNVGAFESSSAGFHIFSNDDLRISTNGSGVGTTALTLDKTTKDATFEGNILAGNISGSSFNGTGLVSGSVLRTLNGTGVVSGSTQLSGYISASGGFTANETIIATGPNSVTSSNILALDTTNNYMGINQSSPEVTLHMTGEGANSAQIRMEQHNDSGDAPDIRTRKSRGTAASPSKNNAGDFIYRQNSERYNGSSYVTVGQLAVDTNSSNADRFQLTLTVSEDGGSIDAANNQFKIDGNDGGAITFNNAYKFPTSDGSANQVLQTNGSGVLSFSDAAAGYTDSDNTDHLNSLGVVSGSSQITLSSVNGYDSAEHFTQGNITTVVQPEFKPDCLFLTLP
jgi:hypothetical protein